MAGYTGDEHDEAFVPRLTNPGVTFVIGGNLNPFGHALFRLGTDVGYIHVDELRAFPKTIPAARLLEYLRDNNKSVLRHVDVELPFRQGALNRINELRRDRWLWLCIPHNCVTFCETILDAGGADWSAVSNLPLLIRHYEMWKSDPAPRNAQANVVIDGPATLKKGESAVYTGRTIGLPPGGSFRWWPRVGQELDGLYAMQAGSAQTSVRAVRSSGKAVVSCRYVYPGGAANGRREITLR